MKVNNLLRNKYVHAVIIAIFLLVLLLSYFMMKQVSETFVAPPQAPKLFNKVYKVTSDGTLYTSDKKPVTLNGQSVRIGNDGVMAVVPSNTATAPASAAAPAATSTGAGAAAVAVSKDQPNDINKRANLLAIALYNAVRDTDTLKFNEYGANEKVLKHMKIVGMDEDTQYARFYQFMHDNVLGRYPYDNIDIKNKEVVALALGNMKGLKGLVEDEPPELAKRMANTFGTLPPDDYFYPTGFTLFDGKKSDAKGSPKMCPIITPQADQQKILDAAMAAIK